MKLALLFVNNTGVKIRMPTHNWSDEQTIEQRIIRVYAQQLLE